MPHSGSPSKNHCKLKVTGSNLLAGFEVQMGCVVVLTVCLGNCGELLKPWVDCGLTNGLIKNLASSGRFRKPTNRKRHGEGAEPFRAIHRLPCPPPSTDPKP